MIADKAADVSGDGTISRKEFPLLLKYIVYFDNVWEKFASLDKDGDHQLNMEEFHQGALLLGLGEEHGVSWATTVQEFGMMDEDGGGAVRFDEFCAWCARKTHAAAEEGGSKQQTATASNAAPPKKPIKALYSMMYHVTIDEDGEEEPSDELPVS